MKLFVEDLTRYRELKRISTFIGKPCVWSIIMLLMETENRAINVTALVSKLGSNYRAVMRCINYMKSLQIVEEVVIGRLRLIKLLDNQLVKAMLEIAKELKARC